MTRQARPVLTSFGFLRFSRASKHWKCARGQYCEQGRLIEPKSWYASVAIKIKQIVKRSGVDRELDSGEVDEGGKVVLPEEATVVKLPIIRRFHLVCLTPWAEYECDKLDKIVAPRGRPEGALSSLLSPEEQKRRKQLTQRRAYLMRKIVKTTLPAEVLALARELVIDLRRELGPIQLNPRRYPDKARQISTLVSKIQCSHSTKGRLCEIDSEYHCIHCGSCFQPTHDCSTRKVTL